MMYDQTAYPWRSGLLGDAHIAEIWSAERQLGHMLAFEAALARAWGAVGGIPAAMAEEAAEAMAGFTPDMATLTKGTARDGVVVPALVAQLKAAFPRLSAAIHTGATSQDVIDTALALTLKDSNDILLTRLTALTEALAALNRRFGGRPLMGRTRMQAAEPVLVADRVRQWAAPLGPYHTRLKQLRPEVERLQLGGAVGTRAALAPHGDAIAAFMARSLGLANPPSAWHSTRSALVDYANHLGMISGSLGKTGQDICLMAQQGLDEISFTGAGRSSSMPHKQNPVLAEVLVTLARFNAVQISGLHQALVHEQERSGAAWMLEWMLLPPMVAATARSLGAALQLLETIKHIGDGREA